MLTITKFKVIKALDFHRFLSSYDENINKLFYAPNII